MKVTPTAIPDVLIIAPKVFEDERGFFYESFHQNAFDEATGQRLNFVQDNHSRSAKGVLRGLHYQILRPQGKLVRVVKGAVFDVAVDVRKGSCKFGQWVGFEPGEDNRLQMWVPARFAHGLIYKATDYYAPQYERCIAWNDLDIGINWPLDQEPSLAAKDKTGQLLMNAEKFA